MAPDEESSAKVSPIDNNKTLMIDQYTSDAEPGNPELVENIQNIEDAFAHFKPSVEVDFVDEEGGSVNEKLHFGELRDILKDASAKEELKEALRAMLEELENN